MTRALAEAGSVIGLDPNGADRIRDPGGDPELVRKAGGNRRPGEAGDATEPRHSFFYTWSLGHSYVLMGKIEEAIATMKEVLDQNPNYMPAHAYLAFMYTEMGRIEEARSHMAESNRLSPGTSLERD